MSEREAQALSSLKAQLSSEEEEAARLTLIEGESLEGCLLRFLWIRGLQVRPALELFLADLRWRRMMQPARVAEQAVEEVAGCTREVLNDYLPTWFQGFDRQGRPVICSHYGKFRFAPVLKQTSVDNLIRLSIYNSERSARLCGLQSIRLGREISCVVTVVDAEGWDPHNIWSTNAYTWVKGMAKLDDEHYPERLGLMIVINAPRVVYHFWSMVKYLLPDSVRNKVLIFAGREQWTPMLLELIEPEQLPPEYGGCGVHRGDSGIPLSLPEGPP